MGGKFKFFNVEKLPVDGKANRYLDKVVLEFSLTRLKQEG